MQKILELIREFWLLITNFDGSTKFLTSIISISESINKLKRSYDDKVGKYDDDSREFKYIFDLFQTIILNENIIEDDEISVPDTTIFMITNDLKIINANSNFALLVNQPL